MKALKIFGGLIVLILCLLAAGGYYLFSNLDALVKELVESEGPKVTSTDVRLNNVNITLQDARAELTGFSVANPTGFTSKNAFSFENITLDLDPSSLQTDVIVIDEMTVSGVNITAEQKGLDTNIQQLLNLIEKNVGGGANAESETASDSPSKQIKLAVKKLAFTDNSINLITEKYGKHGLVMPKIEAVNLGSPTQGLTPAELGKAIAQPLLDNARKTVEQKLRKIAEEQVKDKAEAKLQQKLDEKLSDKDKEKLDKVKGLFGK